MSRGNKGGWDFVKVGETYQYKEDSFIAMVTIMEDNSDDDHYLFKLRVEKSTIEPPQDGEFEISHTKNFDGYYSGMLQIYENEEYMCNYDWERNPDPAVRKIRVTKLKEVDNPTHPNNIVEGFSKVGKFVMDPIVGQPFILGYSLRTSTVEEVIDKNTFRTLNSIYRIEDVK